MKSTLQDRILACQDHFTESERRLADVTLACGFKLASYSATEIAQMADVSKATVARFFRGLGYANFNDVRTQARDDADRGSPLYELAGVKLPLAPADSLEHHLANDLKNLAQTLQALDAETVEQTVLALSKARRVFIVGFRNGRVLAQYAWALLTQVRSEVVLVPGAGLNLAEDLADLGTADVMLVMDFRRRVALLRPIIEHANNVGARIIVLTDPSATELPARAELVLRCVNHGSTIFDSYIAAMSLLNHLCSNLVLRLGVRARNRLKHIESLHDHYGDLHR
ncbi:MurR/RpiR family transcriptional regulator [Pseudomonas saxonica]|uniref:MurR/RpiR family transcriptional regulator n=1 Tax=Pseudomonas saxonica TaxID=2600598 RepID=UPI002D78B6F9|nr:MurR/RpiR family transcriptional regulator [Pseudomonas saxonica]WRQ73539.1 MurR/RpiR family transcriptional regulator [Pseudomonas saxonica]